MIIKSKGSYSGIIKYSQKTLKLGFDSDLLRTPLKGKSFAPAEILRHVHSGLLVGKHSLRELTDHHVLICQKLGRTSARCRDTIAHLLNEPRVADELKKQLISLFLKAKNDLRIFNLATSSGLIVALIDGIDLGEVAVNHGRCEYCLERKHSNGKIAYFHRMVVISIMSIYGPLPLFFRYCRPEEIVLAKEDSSEESFKAECELSCAKKLLIEIAGDFKGRLPFAVLGGDALMANAPFTELAEALGSSCVFVFKQENRRLFQQAQADFRGNTLGFNIYSESWKNDPSGKGRTFNAQWGTYVDTNRKGENKSVKIFEIERTELTGTTNKGMSLTSDSKFIGPRLVEEIRFGKWHDLENGVFNVLTTQWNILKHIFCHMTNAMYTMTAMSFIALIVSTLYRFGNLKRGGRSFQSTFREFIDHISSTFHSLRLKKIIALHCNSP